MTAPFRITLDVCVRTLRLTCTGLWTHAIMDDFEREMDQTLSRYLALGGPPGKLLILADLRDSTIQTQEIALRLQGGMQRHSSHAERIATLLSSSAIHNAQTKRVTHTEQNGYFSDEGEALTWLNEARTRLPLAG